MISHQDLRELQPLREHQQEQGGFWCQDVGRSRMLEEEDSNDVISHQELCELQPLGEHQQEQGGL